MRAPSGFGNAYKDFNNGVGAQQPMGYAYNGSYQPSNEEKTSVKVHAPPGGKSNFSIGGYGDEPEQNTYGSRKRQGQ